MACDEKGFTLLELILVLAITVLSLAIITPTVHFLVDRMQLEKNTRQLAWVMRSTQQEAMYKEQEKTMSFYPHSNYYKAGDIYYYMEGAEYAAVPTFSAKIGEIPACIFRPAGSSTAGTVVLKSGRGDNLYIITNLFGRTRISPTPPSSDKNLW